MTADKTMIVRIKVEEGKSGLFFATSPDLSGSCSWRSGR